MPWRIENWPDEQWKLRHPMLLLSTRSYFCILFFPALGLYILAFPTSGSPASQASLVHNLPPSVGKAVFGKCDEREDGEQVKRIGEERAADGCV